MLNKYCYADGGKKVQDSIGKGRGNASRSNPVRTKNPATLQPFKINVIVQGGCNCCWSVRKTNLFFSIFIKAWQLNKTQLYFIAVQFYQLNECPEREKEKPPKIISFRGLEAFRRVSE